MKKMYSLLFIIVDVLNVPLCRGELCSNQRVPAGGSLITSKKDNFFHIFYSVNEHLQYFFIYYL